MTIKLEWNHGEWRFRIDDGLPIGTYPSRSEALQAAESLIGEIKPDITSNHIALRKLSERIRRKVGDVRASVTREEADESERLETMLGVSWDANCSRWRALVEG